MPRSISAASGLVRTSGRSGQVGVAITARSSSTSTTDAWNPRSRTARHIRSAAVRSVFAGIRPLVRAGPATRTAALSREHTIHVEPTGLLTIAGGKWTTYRQMAEDCVNHAAARAGLPPRPCVTPTLKLHGPGSGPPRPPFVPRREQAGLDEPLEP